VVRLYRPEREAKYRVRFLLGSRLAYPSRLAVIACCLVFGLAAQLLVSLWVGWGVLLVGALFATTRGVRNKPTLQGERHWEPVTLDEFRQVLETVEKSRHWTRSIFNLASARGVLTLLVALYLVLMVGGALGEFGRLHPLGPLVLLGNLVGEGLTPMQKLWLLDAVALAVPIWLSGLLTAWAPEELVIKVKCLLEAVQYIQGRGHPNWTLHPQMEVTTCPPQANPAKKRGLAEAEPQRQVPRDARLQVRFADAPEDFLGVQVQLSINRVGAAYPYLYCVLLARPAFGLRGRLRDVTEVGKEVVEYSTEKDVEVAVCRQFTTRESGYHTDYDARLRVLASSFKLAEQALGLGADASTQVPAAPTAGVSQKRPAGRAPRRR
jgi:hypothetical protein